MGGNPKDSIWSSSPEFLRHQIKLNVRLSDWRMAQVKKLAARLKVTMREVVEKALDALEQDLKEEDETRASEREILVASRKRPSRR